jgi:hypothetical protein
MMGNHQQAISSFEKSGQESDSPSRRFHLALAYAGTDKLDAARFHLDEAIRMGLKESSLDDKEALLFRALQEQLKEN